MKDPVRSPMWAPMDMAKALLMIKISFSGCSKYIMMPIKTPARIPDIKPLIVL